MSEVFTYDRSRFDVASVRDAQAIILTPEDSTTDHRWATETPYLGGLISDHLDLTKSPRVLDYGCGIGRMAKELLRRHDCTVVGVDTSMNMRALAPTYVLDDRFVACAPASLNSIASVHFALAIWTLQHVPDVGTAITAISAKLRSYGRLFVLNTHRRVIPVQGGQWIDDGADVRELLGLHFKEIAYGVPDTVQTTPRTADVTFWGVYQRRE